MPERPPHAKQENAANPMWGGHYTRAPDELMREINASIGFDKALYKEDIMGSLAHVAMLAAQGILAASEAETLSRGLRQVEGEIDAGGMTWHDELEDIHMHIEARLKEIVGEVGGKLHTARSRNDQVATDLRLYVRGAIDALSGKLAALGDALLDRAEEHAATIMPGFTHLQTAQPVTLGHHLMAYVEMFRRDASRFRDARARLNESPLGAAALAGTSFPLDRQATAAALGFDGPMRNSLDAVGSRDFVIEFLCCCAIAATHLSRLAEELILWSSAPFGFIALSEAFTSGSSIMPQKRNPDAAELVRGKTGRIVGALVTLLTVVKGLPLAYNKDLQEDKEPAFDAFRQLSLCLDAMTGMIRDLAARADRMEALAAVGYSTATDLADWLVGRLGLPFRDAHHITGRIVQEAEAKGCRLDELPLEAMQAVEPRITADLFSVLSVAHSVSSRTSFGGTAPENVRHAIREARKFHAS